MRIRYNPGVALNPRKVVVAMSGGVDSSVAAGLLRQQGYEVLGAFMRLGSPPGVQEISEERGKQGCCSILDAADARRVAAVLDIPLYVLNFQEQFGKIIDYFADEYDRGRTPNPCVRCNQWLKFGALMNYADAVGAQYVATGHYARTGAGPALLRGVDHGKDQSYVLFGLSRAVLERVMLPIGELHKPRVREMAEQMKLPVFNKPDSQEICFVPDGDYAGVLKRRRPEGFRPGEFRDLGGKPVGTHEGHQHFTIGQRKGLGVALGKPAYVVAIDPKTDGVTLGDREALLRRGLLASELNVLCPQVLGAQPIRCTAKIRYNHEPQPASAWLEGDRLRVEFDQPQSAITPGQAVVLYQDERVLGGGWIDEAT